MLLRLTLLAVLIGPVLAARPADPPDDRAKLQGVWHSPADARVRARVIVMDGKVGYAVGDPGGKTPTPGSSFVALSEAAFGEGGGKRYADLTITKDHKQRIDYRSDKDGLVVGINGTEYPVRRVNTRAGDPAAKKLAGTWTVTEVEANGMKAAAKDAGLASVAFTGDRYVWRGADGKDVLNSFYRVRELKDGRAELDVYGVKPDVTIPSLLEVSGDALTVAQPRPGATDRPTGFDTKKAQIFVIRATRAK